ncbi:MAG TPA: M56 family metallopeptidase [Bryobacteraceae bacterium]|nr:M56 family metallopeptidase [Bryobacteraceae bacterium]
MIQHLLESTVFAAAVWLLTLTLRRHHARARHALWMAASIKFLVPFSLFVAIGSHVVRPAPASIPPAQMRFMMVDTVPAMLYAAIAETARPARRVPVLWLLWLAGSVAVLGRWYGRSRGAARSLRESTQSGTRFGIAARISESMLEPAVFGIIRPVLVMPAGMEERLSAEQLEAVFDHELCHVRHRDNLAAAIHMVVETAFWFHPLIWWMGARLVAERERACDEEVVRLGADRAVYAESILRVCEFSIASPVECVSGISGADLKQRIREIMTGGVRARLTTVRKLLLATLAMAAVSGPLAVGLAHPPKIAGQTAAPLKFDVASVKVSADHILWARPMRSPGRIRWTTQGIYLLAYAYGMEWWRISGAAEFGGAIYEIEATTDPHATDAQRRLMMQSLLIDRFGMKAHRVTKNGIQGYALSVGKDGPKMEPAKDYDDADNEGSVASIGPGQNTIEMNGDHATMLQLCDHLQRLLHTSVLDQTGLTGKYNFTFRFMKDEDPQDFTAVVVAIKQIGLKLERYKGPVEFLVIDQISKTPTEN